MSLLKYFAGGLLISSASLSAIDLPSNVQLYGGYRQDDLETRSHRGFSDGSCKERDHHDRRDHSTRAKHVNIWEIGVKARLVMPDLECFCGAEYLRNFYVKGYGIWGTDVGENRFTGRFDRFDRFEDFGGDRCGGRLKDYNTYDYSIGVGYLFDLGCWFDCPEAAISVIGGYAWDEQKLTPKDRFDHSSSSSSSSSSDFSSSSRDHRKLNNRWQGGWLGTEFYYTHCDFLFNLGYEYHWADWHSKEHFSFGSRSESGSGRGFNSFNKHSKEGSGNVVYFDTAYTICDCWEAGVGLRWSRFVSRREHERHHHHSSSSSFSNDFSSSSSFSFHGDRGGRGKWQSMELTANIGYNF